MPALVDYLDAIVEAGGLREWAPRAFAAFAARQPLYALGTRGYPWIEIDFPEDYERAVRDVLPLVEAGSGARALRRGAATPRHGRDWRVGRCTNASTGSVSGRSRSGPTPITCIRAACTARR